MDNVEVLSKDAPYCLNRPNNVNCNYLKAINRINITGARTFSALKEEHARRVISGNESESRTDFDFQDSDGSSHSSENGLWYDDDPYYCEDPEMWRAIYESRGGDSP